jgi:hypothetical protein
MQHIRVSEILSQFRDFSTINPGLLNTKCEIGTEVHHNIHMHQKGLLPFFDIYPEYDRESNIKAWSERGEGYFNSFLQYEAKVKPIYTHMETRFYDDNLMITGQIDALLMTYDLPVISDFKCSYSVDEEIWSMQAHYYKHLMAVNGIKTADYFYWIQLKKDGKKPKVLEIEYDENMMSRCIQEAVLFWERKNDAKCLC